MSEYAFTREDLEAILEVVGAENSEENVRQFARELNRRGQEVPEDLLLGKYDVPVEFKYARLTVEADNESQAADAARDFMRDQMEEARDEVPHLSTAHDLLLDLDVSVHSMDVTQVGDDTPASVTRTGERHPDEM